MQLDLVPLPKNLRGIYGAAKTMPGRALLAHPDLYDAIAGTETSGLRLIYSDIFRSASASLARRKELALKGGKQLAKRPGESPHNFGLAVDIDVNAVLKEYGMSKAGLDTTLKSFGLYCHRLDDKLDAECWHYNALGPYADRWLAAKGASTSRSVEAKIQSIYGAAMRLSPLEVSAALGKLGFKTVVEFQAEWQLDADGVAGEKTQRLLAYLTGD